MRRLGGLATGHYVKNGVYYQPASIILVATTRRDSKSHTVCGEAKHSTISCSNSAYNGQDSRRNIYFLY